MMRNENGGKNKGAALFTLIYPHGPFRFYRSGCGKAGLTSHGTTDAVSV
jgi:hypothetical protein